MPDLDHEDGFYRGCMNLSTLVSLIVFALLLAMLAWMRWF